MPGESKRWPYEALYLQKSLWLLPFPVKIGSCGKKLSAGGIYELGGGGTCIVWNKLLGTLPRCR